MRIKRIILYMAILFIGVGIGYLATLYTGEAEAKTVRAFSSARVERKSIPSTQLVDNSLVKVEEIKTRRISQELVIPVPVEKPAPLRKTVARANGQLIDEFSQASGKNIDVSLEAEHCWAYQDGKLVYEQPISASYGPIVPVGELGDQPHNHLGIWSIFKKEILHHSKAYDCDMRDCLFYCDGHALHACQWSDINKLGTKASHGCIRQHPNMATKLYAWADISTRVRVRE